MNSKTLFQIQTIGDLTAMKNLVKLYVKDNYLQTLKNIETAPKLTYLYIINNELTELDSVSSLPNIEKLYAGSNHIQVSFNCQYSNLFVTFT